uniref:Uncharacterized protein n=1 Tax=Helianthus annuus TaxID=4232 RepID=A0A251T7P9_HELAN
MLEGGKQRNWKDLSLVLLSTSFLLLIIPSLELVVVVHTNSSLSFVGLKNAKQ